MALSISIQHSKNDDAEKPETDNAKPTTPDPEPK